MAVPLFLLLRERAGVARFPIVAVAPQGKWTGLIWPGEDPGSILVQAIKRFG